MTDFSGTVSLYRSLDNETLHRQWLELEERARPFAFQRYTWLRHWLGTIGQEAEVEPLIVLVSTYGRPQLLLPLSILRRGGVRTLEFLGAEMADYTMPVATREGLKLLADEACWQAVFAALPQHDLIHFHRIPERLPEKELFPFARDVAVVADYAHSADLPETREEFLSKLPGSHRREAKRLRRRLAELGDFSFRVYDPEKDDAVSVFEEMIEQKRARCRQTGVNDYLADPAARDFYTGMPADIGPGAEVQLSALLLDGRPVAVSWGVIDSSRYIGLVLSYSPDYLKYSLGKLMVEAVMGWCIDNGIPLMDFSYGAEEYKKIWCNNEQPLYEIMMPVTMAGRLYAGSQRIKEKLKQSPAMVSGMHELRKQLYRFKG